MKRSAPNGKNASPAKKVRVKLPEYHATPMKQDPHGEDIWPAPRDQLDRARDFILKW
jgi:hypothetical protein